MALGVRLALAALVLTLVFVLPWRWLPPPTSAFMLREQWLGDSAVEYRWVPMDEISPNLAIAAVAAEDQKFPDHHGFDLVGMAEALERNQSETGSLRGGSTITQQVAKNLYLWPAQSAVRKGAEAWLTVWIDLVWPKRRILEVYLNVAEFGPGIYGADAASRRAFGKPPSDLTLPQAARLVAVLPSPRRMSIVNPSDYVEGRTREIVDAVEGLGGIRYLQGILN
jgi:monofunctional biosynthetic peptidoglycan transglycosylase